MPRFDSIEPPIGAILNPASFNRRLALLLATWLPCGTCAADREGSVDASCDFEIVFDSERGGSNELYVLDLQTLEFQQVTNAAEPEIANRLPDWSPGGREIVYVSQGFDGRGVLSIVSVPGTRPRPLTGDTAVYENPAWSPDGRWIAFEMQHEGQWGLYLIRPDGTELHRIGPRGVNLFHPAWSPDGARLAVVTGDENSWVIGVLDVRLDRLEILPSPGPQVGSVKWSPDGGHLAFDGVVGTNFDLYAMAVDGSDLRRLTSGPSVDARPEWSPDGNQLVFHTTRDYGSVGGSERWQEFELYVMDLADGAVRRLTRNNAFDAHPDWCTP